MYYADQHTHKHVYTIQQKYIHTHVHLSGSLIGAVTMGTDLRSKGSSLGWLQYWSRALSRPTTDKFSASVGR